MNIDTCASRGLEMMSPGSIRRSLLCSDDGVKSAVLFASSGAPL